MNQNDALAVMAWVIFTLAYMFPWLSMVVRGTAGIPTHYPALLEAQEIKKYKRRRTLVMIVNLFMGWTILGWFIALWMAGDD